MRARLTLAAGTAALALAGSVFAAAPASAACSVSCSGDTTVTFVAGVTGAGLLAFSGGAGATALVPGTGTNLTGALPAGIVTDTRVPTSGTNSWKVQVASTPFTLNGTSGNTTPTTIAASKAKVQVVEVTSAVSGVLSTQLRIAGTSSVTNVASSAISLADGAATDVVTATTTNANTFPYVATLTVDANGAPVGAYTGTVTQSVS